MQSGLHWWALIQLSIAFQPSILFSNCQPKPKFIVFLPVIYLHGEMFKDLSRIVTNALFVWLDQEWRDVLSYTSNPIKIIRLIVMKSVTPFSPQGIAYPIFAGSSRKTSNQTDDMWFSCIYHSIWCFTTGSEFEAKPYFPNLNLYSEFLLVIEMVLCRTGSKTNTSIKKTQPC